MADRSKIEWTDATWNPVTGCTRVSSGCANCYIDWAPPFRIEGRHFVVSSGERSHAIGSTTGVRIHPDRLDQPLRWRKPRRIFVNSLSDVFHQDVPDEYIARIFAVMALAQRHTFQVLTKRHGRMRSLLRSAAFRDLFDAEKDRVVSDAASTGVLPRYQLDAMRQRWWRSPWPLPNVWLGVTVEDQTQADLRIPALLETPAAVRFLSCEPLLARVRLCRCEGAAFETQTHPFIVNESCPLHGSVRVDWVIAGGESGPDARPMHPDWARALRDDCQTVGVPFLFKQWGEWGTHPDVISAEDRTAWATRDGRIVRSWADARHSTNSGSTRLVRIGKKATGRILDGRTWDGYPLATEEPA